MPAKTINLLPHSNFDQTPVGKVLRWALTYGRYIIISTEIVVLMAFIFRFSLDRQITDLKEEIEQKEAIIKANQGFEQQFRSMQKRTNEVGALLSEKEDPVSLIKYLETITPSGIYFSSISLAKKELTISATAQNNSELAIFIKQLKSSTKVSQVSIGALSKKSTGTGEVSFKVEAKVK